MFHFLHNFFTSFCSFFILTGSKSYLVTKAKSWWADRSMISIMPWITRPLKSATETVSSMMKGVVGVGWKGGGRIIL